MKEDIIGQCYSEFIFRALTTVVDALENQVLIVNSFKK
jgi:hypothetical protein